MQPLEKGQFGYTRREERLNFYTHLAALIAAIVGAAIILFRALSLGDTANIAAIVLFSIALIGVFFSSSRYHGLSDGDAKMNAKILDHASIYWFICALYTALIFASARNIFGLAVGVCVWVLGTYGTVKKFKHCPTGEKPNELPLYVAMTCLIFPIFRFFNLTTIAFLLAAAVLNIAGLYFYRQKGKEFTHALWHLFSFGATVCDFLAVFFAL